MKPINKVPRLIRIATSVFVAGSLAIIVLSAQDDLDTVRQAADQGDADAQYNLGLMYANGEGVPEDDAEAVRWYRLAADQGTTRARPRTVQSSGEHVRQWRGRTPTKGRCRSRALVSAGRRTG